MFALALAYLAAAAAPPTPEQTDWVKQHAIPLKTVEAGNGFDDLQPLKALIGDARIVSLGEPTHGTREAFQFKHRMVEFLAGEMGFTIFSIEASTPESYAINPWVLGEDNDSDPAALVGGMYFWTWNTEEVLAMVKWMREFNAREKKAVSGKQIQFTGFDMQTPDVAREIVRKFVAEYDPEIVAMVQDCYRKAARSSPNGGAGSAGGFGVGTATFPVAAAKGKKLVYSGWIRTKDVTNGFAGLWWRCDLKAGTVGAFDNMAGRGPTGTTEWNRYEVALDVPADTVNINFGMLMVGKGEAWFDDLRIELDGQEWTPPADEPMGLDFENPDVRSFMGTPPGMGYATTRSDENPHGGKACLKIASVAREPGKPLDEAEKVSAKEATRLAKKVLDELRDKRAELVAKAGAKDTDWALHNARIVWQGYRMASKGMSRDGFAARDTAMADNVEWILQQNPEAKIVLWAHNGHVARQENWMGKFLEEKYPDTQMVVFGFATGGGEYTAMAGGVGLKQDLKLEEPPEDSVEAVLASAGVPRLVIDLRRADANNPGSNWARGPRPIRSIGALEQKGQFYPAIAAEQFDAMVYLDRTTAAVQLGKTRK